MTRHELAKMRFQQLAAALTHGTDEEQSDQLEAWLRDEVVPVVEDLFDNPVFRRHILKIPEQLFASPPTELRASINAVADAFVADAQAMVDVAHEFHLVDALADQDRALDQGWLTEQSARGLDVRGVIEKVADRPWFDVVNPEDFWTPTFDLHLRHADALLTRQFRRTHSETKLLGDHVIERMFARFDFWKRRLDHGRQRLQDRLGRLGQTAFSSLECLFGCVIDADQKFQAFRSDWRQGADARMRSACMTLLQTYVAYHHAPRLPWLGIAPQSLAVQGPILRSFFRHQGTLTLVNREDDGQLRVVGERPASLVEVQMIRQVAAALEDVAALYHRGVHADDQIAEAKDRYPLVVVVNPRMVFWQGVLLDLPWTGTEMSWNLMLHLAVKREDKLSLHHFGLTGSPTNRGLSVRKAQLIKFLSGCAAGEALAVRIEKERGGPCFLDVEPQDVKVLDLDADELMVDISELTAVGSGISAGEPTRPSVPRGNDDDRARRG